MSMFNDRIKELEKELELIKIKNDKELKKISEHHEITVEGFKKAHWKDLERLMQLQIRAISDIGRIMADINIIFDDIKRLDWDRLVTDTVKEYLETKRIMIE
jgi:hypothetical protein